MGTRRDATGDRTGGDGLERADLRELPRAPIQLVFAQKAHPRDAEGKQLIKRLFDARD